jgi:hypothetical protein
MMKKNTHIHTQRKKARVRVRVRGTFCVFTRETE